MAESGSKLNPELGDLEFEWRQAYEESIAARAAYQTLARSRVADACALDLARERMDRAEALKARVMATIERSEDRRRSRG